MQNKKAENSTEDGSQASEDSEKAWESLKDSIRTTHLVFWVKDLWALFIWGWRISYASQEKSTTGVNPLLSSGHRHWLCEAKYQLQFIRENYQQQTLKESFP